MQEIDCGGPARCIGRTATTVKDAKDDFSPFCALADTRDPRCPTGWDAELLDQKLCDGDTVLTCSKGYLEKKQPCAKGLQCVPGKVPGPGYYTEHGAFCHTTKVKDPKCSMQEGGYCAGNEAVYCYLGYVTGTVECLKKCSVSAGVPHCPS